MTKTSRKQQKTEFKKQLADFAVTLAKAVSYETGEWTIKGFIDVYKNIYTISSDTKIISKILEIHLFPLILEFAENAGYNIVLAEKQNWYPDFSFVHKKDNSIKFAVDLKTTYRDPNYPGHVNGFTLGSHGTYFKDRTSKKNVQFPYSEYSGHFCLGIIYSRIDSRSETSAVGERKTTALKNLKSIVSVIRDFEFFVAEKWEIASDTEGSKNTANIGSITNIKDILSGRGIFAKLGEFWFDEYWMNYGLVTMVKKGKSAKITNLKDFLEFKGKKNLAGRLVAKNTKRKNSI